MNVAFVQNKDRSSFVEPTLTNITAAVSNADVNSIPSGLHDWSRVSLILEPRANSYPIVSFTYILVYQELNVRPLMTLDKAKALVDFIWYMVHEGQSAGTSLDYATLPQSIVTIDETSIKSITYNGQSLPTSGFGPWFSPSGFFRQSVLNLGVWSQYSVSDRLN